MVEVKKTIKKEVDSTKKIKETKNKEIKKSLNSSDFAVIKTGGKQYFVSQGIKIKVEKLPQEEGKEIELGEVLLKTDGEDVRIGNPFLEGEKVKAKVLNQFKDDKIIVFKYKKRKNYRKKQGHRQNLTELEILSI